VFERFTERARQVVVLAQDEARALRHNHIGTEHLLLGLLREQEGIAARVLGALGIAVDPVRERVAQVAGEDVEPAAGQMPFTPRAKKVLELSLREAQALGHHFIGTEHMLLGLVRENDGVAARILLELGADAETVRAEVIGTLSGGVAGRMPRPTPTPPGATSRRRRPSVPIALLVTGWVLFALALGAGVLIGWAIWA
jgi:ATP-dependent Clp protease ATP-binding subunit ClpC